MNNKIVITYIAIFILAFLYGLFYDYFHYTEDSRHKAQEPQRQQQSDGTRTFSRVLNQAINIDESLIIIFYNNYTKLRAYDSITSSFKTSGRDSEPPSRKITDDKSTHSGFHPTYPWSNIVEPYRITYFKVIDTSANNQKYGSHPHRSKAYNDRHQSVYYQYKWYVDNWLIGTTISSGDDLSDSIEMPIAFTNVSGVQESVRVDIYQIISDTARKNSPPSSSTATTITTTTKEIFFKSLSTLVMCKYVRREIRSLYDVDRIAFFQAVSVMQRVPTQVGKALYNSDKYYSKDYFNRLHLYYGGDKNCDHWHQGPGFPTSHMTLTLMYEQSLQSINPSIALPYWDFTLDSTFYTPQTFREMKYFSDTIASLPQLHSSESTSKKLVPSGTKTSSTSSSTSSYSAITGKGDKSNGSSGSGGSGLFCDDWFGSMSMRYDRVIDSSQSSNSLGAVASGVTTGSSSTSPSLSSHYNSRFSHVPVMGDAVNFSSVLSPYGTLRSPWNVDPSPYTTRYKTIYNYDNNLKPSGCKQYHAGLKQNTWKGLYKQLNANAHGHIHELIGGSYNPSYDANGDSNSNNNNNNYNNREFRYKPPIATTTTTASRYLNTESTASKTATTTTTTGATTDSASVSTATDSTDTNSDTKNAYAFLHNTEAFSKILWRNDILICPTNCQLPFSSSSSSSSSYMNNNNIDNVDISTTTNNIHNNIENIACRCQCTDTKQNMSAATIFDKLKISSSLTYSFVSADNNNNNNNNNVAKSFSNADLIDTQTGKLKKQLNGYSVQETTQLYEDILSFLCDPGYMGDMFQATSTNDITFWVLHPTLERLWHVKRLLANQGLISFNHTWPDEDVHCAGHHSTDITPFHYDIFNSDSDTSISDNSDSDNKSKKSNTADGDTHNKNNKNTKINGNTNAKQGDNHNHVNSNSDNGNKSKQKKLHYLSNFDLYQLLDPSSDVFPYLYDSLLWTHCEVLGFDMSGL